MIDIKRRGVYFKDYNGFTLIEILIALVISSIIIASVYKAFQSQQGSYAAQDQVAEMQQNIRAALSVMLREIRMAGYDPDDKGGAGFTTINNNSVVFSYIADEDGEDNDNDGNTDESGELKTIQYDLYDAYGDGDMDIGRQVGTAASTKRAIAENIDNIEFNYLDVSGNPTGVAADIRSIQVSILARARVPDSNFTNSATYTTASGIVWNPTPDDGYRRRLLITHVKCRNMGL